MDMSADGRSCVTLDRVMDNKDAIGTLHHHTLLGGEWHNTRTFQIPTLFKTSVSYETVQAVCISGDGNVMAVTTNFSYRVYVKSLYDGNIWMPVITHSYRYDKIATTRGARPTLSYTGNKLMLSPIGHTPKRCRLKLVYLTAKFDYNQVGKYNDLSINPTFYWDVTNVAVSEISTSYIVGIITEATVRQARHKGNGVLRVEDITGHLQKKIRDVRLYGLYVEPRNICHHQDEREMAYINGLEGALHVLPYDTQKQVIVTDMPDNTVATGTVSSSLDGDIIAVSVCRSGTYGLLIFKRRGRVYDVARFVDTNSNDAINPIAVYKVSPCGNHLDYSVPTKIDPATGERGDWTRLQLNIVEKD